MPSSFLRNGVTRNRGDHSHHHAHGKKGLIFGQSTACADPPPGYFGDMHTKVFTALALFASCACSWSAVRLENISSGFERPVWAGMPKQSRGKLWVMEQAGKVWILDLKSGKRQDQAFLDIESKVTREGNEQGMLGLAFDPNFHQSGRYYVYYISKQERTCVSRFQSKDGFSTTTDTEEVLLQYDQPYRNHNGGWIDFGPDGMLYIGSGDGGSANDPNGYGQSLNTMLGKILRIDVSTGTDYKIPSDNPFVGNENTRQEIWAYGIRNPWRCSFDRETKDFWIGDVGQNHWEEINYMPHGKGAGANYGWRLREGLIATPKDKIGGEKPANHVDPVYTYQHGSGPTEGLSVTGGYVYRGSAIPELKGRYIFADYQQPRIWSFRLENGKLVDFNDHSKAWQPDDGLFNLIASFAEDNDGELFVVCLTGNIYKLIKR